MGKKGYFAAAAAAVYRARQAARKFSLSVSTKHSLNFKYTSDSSECVQKGGSK
jgi:hypothetical protein